MSQHVYDWNDVELDQPMPSICRQVIRGEKAMVSRVTLEAGAIVPTHSHENEQIAMLISGRMLFTIGEDEEVELKAGQVLLLPSNIRHGAIAAEDSVVLDVFAPPADKMGIDR